MSWGLLLSSSFSFLFFCPLTVFFCFVFFGWLVGWVCLGLALLLALAFFLFRLGLWDGWWLLLFVVYIVVVVMTATSPTSPTTAAAAILPKSPPLPPRTRLLGITTTIQLFGLVVV